MINCLWPSSKCGKLIVCVIFCVIYSWKATIKDSIEAGIKSGQSSTNKQELIYSFRIVSDVQKKCYFLLLFIVLNM